MMVLFGLNLVLFQFHKGTIRTELQVLNLVSLLHFNSIKVQLEQTCCAVLRQRWRNFNSIKVQLEPLQGEIDSLEVLNFNSIKVQLEPKFNLFDKEVHSFQFHKGTIRTCFGWNASPLDVSFQFHKGTIRTEFSFFSSGLIPKISIP